jgi:sugar fermentation stimulation protein A
MEYSFFTKKEFFYDIGEFIERPNRYVAMVKYKNKIIRCHVPDPGRLLETFKPNCTVLLRFPKIIIEKTKTEAGLIGVFLSKEKIWVSTDSQLASRFIREKWKELPYFMDYSIIIPEFTYGESRLDFLLKKDNEKCLVEVKTVGLKKDDNIGYFPDAPTKRGTKHVRELISALKDFDTCIVIFFVPRSDIVEVRPNKDLDGPFYDATKEALTAGVKFIALRCSFTTKGIKFDKEIPVNIIF